MSFTVEPEYVGGFLFQWMTSKLLEGWGDSITSARRELFFLFYRGDNWAWVSQCFSNLKVHTNELGILLGMEVLHLVFCLFVLGCAVWDLSSLTGNGTCASFFGSEESPSLVAREVPGAVFLTSSCVMSVLQVCDPQFEQRRLKAPTQGLYLRCGGMEFWIWRPRGSIISILFTLHHLHASLNPLVSQDWSHTPSSAPCLHLASRSSFSLGTAPPASSATPFCTGSSTYTFQDFLALQVADLMFLLSFRAQWLRRSSPPHGPWAGWLLPSRLPQDLHKWLLLVQGHARALHFHLSAAPATVKSSFCSGLHLVLCGSPPTFLSALPVLLLLWIFNCAPFLSWHECHTLGSVT